MQVYVVISSNFGKIAYSEKDNIKAGGMPYETV